MSETRRFVCVLDTRAPAVVSMLLRSYCTLFGPSDPVELAICVPGAPAQAEAQVVMQLLGALAPDPDAYPDVVLYSHTEAVTLPYDAAVTSPGDHVGAGAEAADALTAMSAVRHALDSGTPLPAPRPGSELRKRLGQGTARADRGAERRGPNRAERRGRQQG